MGSDSALNLEQVPVTSVAIYPCIVVVDVEVSFLTARVRRSWACSMLGQASPLGALGLGWI